ncbi:hypothetical protein ACFQL4_12110 [Halosimplex aquaticum]
MSPRVLHYTDLENAYDTPERIARVAGLLADRRGPDALLAGSGDNTGPGVLSLVTDGRQSLDFFDAVGPDVETVGNHDFDHGFDALESVVADSPSSGSSRTSASTASDSAPRPVSSPSRLSRSTGRPWASSASSTPRPRT